MTVGRQALDDRADQVDPTPYRCDMADDASQCRDNTDTNECDGERPVKRADAHRRPAAELRGKGEKDAEDQAEPTTWR